MHETADAAEKKTSQKRVQVTMLVLLLLALLLVLLLLVLCVLLVLTFSLLQMLRKTYDEVCSNFKPVMHHFFLEHYAQPTTWFERRLAYTRSVAVSSMVGYILGLGDRHTSNILIDEHTAEVIHMD